jgi:hypothetical protein
MHDNKRREIIEVSGLTILVVMALAGDLLIAGAIYRWHTHQLFREEKIHNIAMSDLLKELQVSQNKIVALEGATSWNATEYAQRSPLKSR